MAWPAIRRGDNTLLLAPTGSGKTLAAFLCAIDDLCRRGTDGDLADGVQVLYISPLKALGNDIHRNLTVPLREIRERSGAGLSEIRTAVRTGDTPQSERAQMVRTPPHILITTPESLYLLLGSKRMRSHLQTVRTVIVDEVHALCDSKRGVHLSVSLEQLAVRTDAPFQRIGCSATLAPLDEIARSLVGRDADGAERPCTLVDAGTRKGFDVQAVAPLPDFFQTTGSALWASACELLAKEIAAHDTTLVFCNSRHKAERTALQLTEAVGDASRVGVHHGSMSREVRLETEDALKAGELDAMVATASLELGIDIGSVDLVYQLESPKSVATGLQRIGRAGHLLDEVSKGRVLIFERDELLEAAVVCRGMLDGKIDAIHLPRNCLDVLA
jgi:ATP-dependent Lhr-like helicase